MAAFALKWPKAARRNEISNFSIITGPIARCFTDRAQANDYLKQIAVKQNRASIH